MKNKTWKRSKVSLFSFFFLLNNMLSPPPPLLDNGGYIKPNSQAKKTACSVNKAAEICNTATPRATAGLIQLSHSLF